MCYCVHIESETPAIQGHLPAVVSQVSSLTRNFNSKNHRQNGQTRPSSRRPGHGRLGGRRSRRCQSLSSTTFSFEAWVEDIIANPDTALTVDEAVAAAEAADVVGSAGGLWKRATCDVSGWSRANVCLPPPYASAPMKRRTRC